MVRTWHHAGEGTAQVDRNERCGGLHTLSAVTAQGLSAPETQHRVLPKPLGRLRVPPREHAVQPGPQDELLRGPEARETCINGREALARSLPSGERRAHKSSNDSYCLGREEEAFPRQECCGRSKAVRGGGEWGWGERQEGRVHSWGTREAHTHAWFRTEPQDGVRIVRTVTPKVRSLFSCTLGLQ